MHIHGIGIMSSMGRGLAAHRSALAAGVPPVPADGIHRVKDSDLKDPLLAKEARRAGRFDRMAILAGLDALVDAGTLSGGDLSKMGLILATGLGPHVTTFRFLDDLINFKEKDVSPTLFSHSVHNAAASYLSLLTGIRGPTLTVTRFSSVFCEALTLARCWLAQKRCEQVLVGVVDEIGDVMEAILKAHALEGNSISGEGSVFFVLSQSASSRNYGTIESIENNEQKALSVALFGRQPCQEAFQIVVSLMTGDSSVKTNKNG